MRIAGIVTFNPNIKRLKENIESIRPQVEIIIIVDNGSTNSAAIKELYIENNTIFLWNEKNEGIARALNQIVEKAHCLGAEWVLTLDQDSVCRPNLIDRYENYTDTKDVCSLTCYIQDRNFEMDNLESRKEDFVKSCITAGNYIQIREWKILGGFDEQFFIDKVDTDYCYRLALDHKKIKRIDYVGLIHEVGTETKVKHIFGKK